MSLTPNKLSDHKYLRDPISYHEKKPDIQRLLVEYQRSAYHGTMVSKMTYADDIRYARWPGQTDDGKKHSWARPEGDPAFPFEGASDVRCRLVDRLIRDQKALLMTAFNASTLKVGGTEINDTMAASSATNLMRWLVETKMNPELKREAELAADYMLTYGWTVVQVSWDRKLGLRKQTMTMQELQEVAMQEQQMGTNNTAMLIKAIMDETKEDYAIELLKQSLPQMKTKEMKIFVREMREQGQGQLEEIYIEKNLPIVTALKPFDEVCFPPETSDLQKARVIFRRQYMTEVELRSMVNNAGWDKAFVEKAVRTMGNHYYFNDPNLVPTTTMLNSNIQRGDYLIEVVWAYYRQLDEKDIPSIYYTVFSPQVGSEEYAIQDMLNYAHGEYPFIALRHEMTRRQTTESRGIPEISKTEQDEIKAQHDAIRDRTAFEVLPPVKVVKRIGALNRIAPAQVLPVTNKDDYTWLEPPQGRAEYAFNVITQIETNLGNYYGYNVGETVDPNKVKMLQQLHVNNWLSFWTQCYKQLFSLCLQFMPEEEIERITGAPLKQGMNDIHSEYDFNVRFDVRDTDPEFVMEKLKSIVTTVVPLDTGGVIDRNKLVKLIMEAISPDAARELVIDQTTASQKLYKDVVNDVGMMMLGNEAQYVENDPSAPTKMQYLQEIIQKNPKAQQAMQSDQIFQILLQNYSKNLQMSIEQQKNKEIGRIGVSSAQEDIQEAMAEQQQQAQEQQMAPEQQMQQQGGVPQPGAMGGMF
jgi:hypothetical protein